MTAEGVEPSTLALKVRCSTTELHGHTHGHKSAILQLFCDCSIKV